MPELPPPLAATLDALAPALATLRHDWWLIGSGAMALLGLEGLTIGDVDVLAHPDDAKALLASLGCGWAPGEASARFRSGVFGRWTGAPLGVDVLGDFRVRSNAGWVLVRPVTRLSHQHNGFDFWMPSVAEMIAICELFGRPKDVERAALLRSLLAGNMSRNGGPKGVE
jgi:hypothetical protein